MSLRLPGLPTEILANIVSYFSNWEDVCRLFVCGNSLLTTKIKSGGVTKVTLDRSYVRLSALEIALSCNIDTLKMTGSWQYHSVRDLYSESLRHLKITNTSPSDLIIGEQLNFEVTALSASCCAFHPWIVSSTFPNLQSLRLTADFSSWKEVIDESVWHSFLSGLPRSLASLSLSCVPITDWDALPPHLTSLKGVYGVYPICDSLMSSLLELELHLDKWPHSMVVLDKGTDSKLFSKSNLLNLVFPQNLTSLTLRWFPTVFFDDSMLPKLPTALTYLSWFVEYGYCGVTPIFVQSILALTPSSVQHLVVDGFHIQANYTECSSYLLPKIEKLELPHRTSVPAQLFQVLLQAMPNVKTLMTYNVLEPEHLQYLNPGITSIQSSLSPEFFETPVDDVYPLTRFANLTDLEVGPGTHFDFHFEAVPSSLTKIKLISVDVTTHELALAPPNLESFTAYSVMMSSGPSSLETLFLGPSSPYIEELPIVSYDEDSHWKFQEKVLWRPTQTFFKESASQGSSQDSTHASSRRLPLELEIDPFWGEAVTLPPSLTALRLESFSGFKLPNPPGLASNLVYLDLEANIPADLDLGYFEKLHTLKFYEFEPECISRCPPNLARFCAGQIKFNDSFLPLPPSLTSFIFGELIEISLESIAASLPNLQEVGSVENAYPLQEFAQKPRPSIKTLLVDNLHTQKSFIENLPTNFPSLESLHIARATSYKSIYQLSSQYSHRLKIHGGCIDFVSADFEMLFSAANARPGSLVCDEDGSIHGSLTYALRHAMPNWSWGAYSGSRISFNNETWPTFAKLLSPDTTTLSLTVDQIGPSKAIFDLPKNVTKLELDLTPHDLQMVFPETIKSLIAVPASISKEFMASLPSSLTSLELRTTRQTFDEDCARALPQGLVTLKLLVAVTNEALSALPSTLVHLHLIKHVLTASNFESLSAGVRFFEGFPTRGCAVMILSEPRRRNVTWIAPPMVIAQARYILAVESGVDFAGDSFVFRIKSVT